MFPIRSLKFFVIPLLLNHAGHDVPPEHPERHCLYQSGSGSVIAFSSLNVASSLVPQFETRNAISFSVVELDLIVFTSSNPPDGMSMMYLVSNSILESSFANA
ncbi:MAG: hypothetical protein QT01_C0003G0002 [archaeon GW2011_AR6]|nr:MAG: hypothetical protein QT01_C0003G0002 [archaeon GW2011_AR6]